jgi:hypothetical protein
VSSGSSCGVAAAAPLELPPPVEVPTAGVITTGLVIRLGGDTLVPATESDSPTATGRTDAPADTGAGAEPAAGTAVGVAVAVIAVAVAVVAGTGATAPTPNPDWALAAGVPGTVAPAVGARSGVELAAGAPTVEVAGDVTSVEVVVAGGAGEMLPPVRAPGPAPEGSVEAGVTAALVIGEVCVELVCALTGAEAQNVVNERAAPTIAIVRMAIAR